MDPRTEKMAGVLINYCLAVKPGDWVTIQSPIAGDVMVEACYEAVLTAGGNPTVNMSTDAMQEAYFRLANSEQLEWVSPAQLTTIEQADCAVSIMAPTNTRVLAAADPTKMSRSSKAQEPMMETFMRRTEEGTFRWTVCAYPTPAGAQDAGMSLRDYADFVYGAGLLDQADPAAAWQEQAARQQQLIDFLKDKKTVHITGPGTDLTVGIEGRTWLNDDGKLNFPGGEVFTGPQEDRTEGVIQFNFPGFYYGQEVAGVHLVFERGRVIELSATANEEFLRATLDTDAGARVLGEFSFGTNPGIQTFTRNVLFDEKIGGTLHMALGRAYPESGGKNLSAVHWDMVYNLRNGSEVTVDGQLFSRNGEFQI